MLIENLKSFSFVIDANRNILSSDDMFKKFLGDRSNLELVTYIKDRKLLQGVVAKMAIFELSQYQKFVVRLLTTKNEVKAFLCIVNRINEDNYNVVLIEQEQFDRAIRNEIQTTEYDKQIYSLYGDITFVFDTINRCFVRITWDSVVLYDSEHFADKKIEKNIRELVFHEDMGAFNELMGQLEKGNPRFSYEIRIRKSNNDEYLWYKIDVKTIFDNGIPRFSVGIAADVNSQKNKNEELKHSIALDPMTGLLNKVAIKQYAIEKIKERTLKNDEKMIALLVIDIDNFKSINDSFGHTFGDSVIIEIANILREKVNPVGSVGRIGGDEFMAVIDKLDDPNELPIICKSICYGFENIIRDDVVGFQNSCTIGASKYPIDAIDYDTLFLMADKTLYRGKKKGKNCYVIYNVEKHGSVEGNRLLNNYVEVSNEKTVSDGMFVSETINKLYSKKNLNGTLLSIINRFSLDLIRIMNVDNDGYRLTNFSSVVGVRKNLARKYEMEQCATKLTKMLDQEGKLISNRLLDYEDSDPEVFEHFFKPLDIRACLLIASDITDNGMNVISFEMNSKKRLWSKSEIESLAVIGRFILEFNKYN